MAVVAALLGGWPVKGDMIYSNLGSAGSFNSGAGWEVGSPQTIAEQFIVPVGQSYFVKSCCKLHEAVTGASAAFFPCFSMRQQRELLFSQLSLVARFLQVSP
jgi:hypothetical protein